MELRKMSRSGQRSPKNLENWSFHVFDMQRTAKNITSFIPHVNNHCAAHQPFCFACFACCFFMRNHDDDDAKHDAELKTFKTLAVEVPFLQTTQNLQGHPTSDLSKTSFEGYF